MRVQIVVQDPETGSCICAEHVQISFDLFCAWETKTLSRFVTFPVGCMLGQNAAARAAAFGWNVEDFRDGQGQLDGSSSSQCRFSMRDSLESVGMSPGDF